VPLEPCTPLFGGRPEPPEPAWEGTALFAPVPPVHTTVVGPVAPPMVGLDEPLALLPIPCAPLSGVESAPLVGPPPPCAVGLDDIRDCAIPLSTFDMSPDVGPVPGAIPVIGPWVSVRVPEDVLVGGDACIIPPSWGAGAPFIDGSPPTPPCPPPPGSSSIGPS
jgi:hypothetical protein